MPTLTLSKGRAAGRSETLVQFGTGTANAEWDGVGCTVAGDGNGVLWGHVGAPVHYNVYDKVLAGGTTSITVDCKKATNFDGFTESFLAGKKLFIYRPVNGVRTLIRSDPITTANCHYMRKISGNPVITDTTFEFNIPTDYDQNGSYTFFVARVTSDGDIGPVASATVSGLSDASYTVGTAAAPTTTGSSVTVAARDAGMEAVLGLTAVVRGGTTHTIDLAWNAALVGDDEYQVFINSNDADERLDFEGEFVLPSGVAILADDEWMIHSDPVLEIARADVSRRAWGSGTVYGDLMSPIVAAKHIRDDANPVAKWVEYGDGGAMAKPDLRFCNYHLEVTGTGTVAAEVSFPFHGGELQKFYEVLVQSEITVEMVLAADAAVTADFNVGGKDNSLFSETLNLTTSAQTFTRTFTPDHLATSNAGAFSWTLTAGSNTAALKVLSVRMFYTSPGRALLDPAPPSGQDIRDHRAIKSTYFLPMIDAICSLDGFGMALSAGSGGCTLDTLYRNCDAAGCYPHEQLEWAYPADELLDYAAFKYATVASGHAMAARRNALGYDVIDVEFPTSKHETGNEIWNAGYMRETPTGLVDSATAEVYGQGSTAGMAARFVWDTFKSSPHWPVSNTPTPYAGGWVANVDYNEQVLTMFPDAEYISAAAYTNGADVSGVLLADDGAGWASIPATVTLRQDSLLGAIETSVAAFNLANGRAVKTAIYEGWLGQQNGINGVSLTLDDLIIQETMGKSRGAMTAAVYSLLNAGRRGWGPFSQFTRGRGYLWQIAQPLYNGGEKHIGVAMTDMLTEYMGRCRFVDRNVVISKQHTTDDGSIPTADVIHLESLDYPGRVALFACNLNVDYSGFDPGHPDYDAGATNAATLRYRTGYTSLTPLVRIQNVGNFREHNAYKVGFRPVAGAGSTFTSYTADPLCVSLAATPSAFTNADAGLIEWTLAGMNSVLEIYEGAS
ncbi:MAG: hypothetical protein ACPG4X_21210 [Pikeienuella sp.]